MIKKMKTLLLIGVVLPCITFGGESSTAKLDDRSCIGYIEDW